MKDYLIKEDVFMALTGDITDCTIEEFIARLRDKLSKLPSVGKDINVTTNEDCISRQAVLDGLASIAKVKARSDAQKSLMGRIMFFVEQLPPVTPKEKTGRWISFGIQGKIDGQIVKVFACSECGAISIFRVSNGNIVNGGLCPNCGAKMQEVENDT